MIQPQQQLYITGSGLISLRHVSWYHPVMYQRWGRLHLYKAHISTSITDGYNSLNPYPSITDLYILRLWDIGLPITIDHYFWQHNNFRNTSLFDNTRRYIAINSAVLICFATSPLPDDNVNLF